MASLLFSRHSPDLHPCCSLWVPLACGTCAPLVLDAFLQEAIIQDPSLASFLEEPIHLYVHFKNGLEWFKSHTWVGYGIWMQRSWGAPFFVWSKPWACKQLRNIVALFLHDFPHLELTQTCNSIKARQTRKTCTSAKHLVSARLRKHFEDLPSCFRSIHPGSLALLKEIVAGRLKNLAKATELMSGGTVEELNPPVSRAHKGIQVSQGQHCRLLTYSGSFIWTTTG